MPVQAIPIELGGESHTLRYDFRALARLEKEFGTPIVDIGERLKGKLNLADLTILLWTGLLHEDKSMTQEKAEDLVGGEDILYLASKVTEALTAAFPAVKEPLKN
jgi:hypothetical protein